MDFGLEMRGILKGAGAFGFVLPVLQGKNPMALELQKLLRTSPPRGKLTAVQTVPLGGLGAISEAQVPYGILSNANLEEQTRKLP
jgi:hypothetical protein